MRTFLAPFMMVALLIAVGAVSASADDKKPRPKQPALVPPRPGAYPVVLIKNADVHKELALTADQVKKVLAAVKSLEAARDDAYKALRDAKESDRAELIAKAQKTLREKGRAISDVLRDELNGEQAARLRQIILQQRGWLALLDVSIAEELELTAEQQQQVRKALVARQNKVQNLTRRIRSGEVKSGEASKRREALQKELDKTIAEIVPAEKRATLEKLRGEPFELRSEE